MLKKYHRILNMGILCFMSVIFLIPGLFSGNLIHYQDQDTVFHLSRIIGLSNVWESPVNFNNFNHHGTIMNVFYPWLTLYPAYILYNLTGNLITAYKLYYLVFTFLTMLIAYFSMYSIKKNDTTALLFSLFYSFSTYRSTDIFKRAALGESIALTFLPLILLGCYYIFYHNYKKWYWLTIGMTLTLYTHLLSVAMAAAVISLIILTTFFSWDKKVQRILSLSYATLSTIFLGLGALVPLLEQSRANELKVPKGTALNGLSPTVLIDNILNNNIYSYSIGIVLFVGILFTISIFKNLSKLDKYIFCCGISCLFLLTDLFPWHLLNSTPALSLQFVFRITSFAVLFFSYSFASSISLIKIDFPQKLLGMVITITLLGTIHYASLSNLYRQHTEDQQFFYSDSIVKSVENYDHTDYANLESLNHSEVRQNLFLLGDNVVEANIEYTDSIYTIEINNSQNTSLPLTIPIYFYKGQMATINTKPTTTTLSEWGTTEIQVPPGTSKINISYNYTFIAKISFVLSGLALVLFTIYIIFSMKAYNE